MKSRNSSRRGAVLIAVLVCLGVAITILMGAVQLSLRQRLQLRQELQMEQTKWLMDAGIGTAMARLQSQPDYEGETIGLSPAIEKYSNASIEITVIRTGLSPDQARVKVAAAVGNSVEQTSWTRRSKEIVVNIGESNQN